MALEELPDSSEMEAFRYARRVLVQAIWREIDKDNSKWERSWYSTWTGMMLHQIKFYMKCLYAWDDRTNEKEWSKMRVKYKNLRDPVISYFNALNDIDNQDILSVSQRCSHQDFHIISAFERDILNISELIKLREGSQKQVSIVLGKRN